MDNESTLFNLVQEIRSTQLDHATNTGRIEAKLDSLIGPGGRITQLEDHNARQWWLTMAVIPVMGVFHAAARKLGIDV